MRWKFRNVISQKLFIWLEIHCDGSPENSGAVLPSECWMRRKRATRFGTLHTIHVIGSKIGEAYFSITTWAGVATEIVCAASTQTITPFANHTDDLIIICSDTWKNRYFNVCFWRKNGFIRAKFWWLFKMMLRSQDVDKWPFYDGTKNNHSQPWVQFSLHKRPAFRAKSQMM